MLLGLNPEQSVPFRGFLPIISRYNDRNDLRLTCKSYLKLISRLVATEYQCNKVPDRVGYYPTILYRTLAFSKREYNQSLVILKKGKYDGHARYLVEHS